MPNLEIFFVNTLYTIEDKKFLLLEVKNMSYEINQISNILLNNYYTLCKYEMFKYFYIV